MTKATKHDQSHFQRKWQPYQTANSGNLKTSGFGVPRRNLKISQLKQTSLAFSLVQITIRNGTDFISSVSTEQKTSTALGKSDLFQIKISCKGFYLTFSVLFWLSLMKWTSECEYTSHIMRPSLGLQGHNQEFSWFIFPLLSQIVGLIYVTLQFNKS